jgi:hypothetical protein
MKKNIIFIMIIAGIMAVSCNKLTEDPTASITATQFYKTQADAISAVAAVYGTLNSDVAADFPIYGRNLNLLIENGSDNQIYAPSNTNPDVRALGTATYVTTNDRVRKSWYQHYYGINRANIAIDNIANIPLTKFSDTSVRSRLIREAKFIRALLYFNLVRLHGAVPLILHNPTTVEVNQLLTGRTSKDSIYQQIIADLTDASKLPATYSVSDKGRVTGGAARSLLAKVYVTRKEWTSALSELQKVIATGTFSEATGGYNYDLIPAFSQVFNPNFKNGAEHIFSVQYGTGALRSLNYLSSSNFSSFSTTAYPGDLPVDSSLYQLFDASDVRRAVTFYTSMYNAATGKTVVLATPVNARFSKFIDFTITPITSQSLSKVNFPVIRYADVLLLYAEVVNELNGGPTTDAYTAINLVRARAHGLYNGNGSYNDHTYDLASGLSQSDFRDIVFQERRKEFIQEAHRWFDLVRRGVNTSTGNSYLIDALRKYPGKTGAFAATANRDTLYPIPQVERDLNPKLTQNPGW